MSNQKKIASKENVTEALLKNIDEINGSQARADGRIDVFEDVLNKAVKSVAQEYDVKENCVRILCRDEIKRQREIAENDANELEDFIKSLKN